MGIELNIDVGLFDSHRISGYLWRPSFADHVGNFGHTEQRLLNSLICSDRFT
jgi:hypothetical protein